MISISAKLCTKPIAHSKSCIPRTLLVTVLSLVRERQSQESRGCCCGETLIPIPIPQVFEGQQVNPENSMWKSFICYSILCVPYSTLDTSV